MRRTLLRSIEIAAWTSGLLCGTILLTHRVEIVGAQQAVATFRGAAPPPVYTPGSAVTPSLITNQRSPKATRDPNQLLGRLEIPSLHLSTPILDDDDTTSLLLGAGHIRGTALPGGLGNFVVAAHRDTYFRPLAGIKAGMTMRVVTPDETFIYIVDSTKIVLPEDVDVLDIGETPQMTLITCYPFHYIGAAPKRFIVSAHLASF